MMSFRFSRRQLSFSSVYAIIHAFAIADTDIIFDYSFQADSFRFSIDEFSCFFAAIDVSPFRRY